MIDNRDVHFKKRYIEMCSAGKEIIERFRTSEWFTKAEGGIVTPKSIFDPGDYFYHPQMEEEETKIVKEVKGFSLVHSTDSESYKEEECVWIPTAEQIKKGLEQLHWSIGDVSDEDDEERLILGYMDSIGKKWSREKKSWIDVKEN